MERYGKHRQNGGSRSVRYPNMCQNSAMPFGHRRAPALNSCKEWGVKPQGDGYLRHH